MSANEVDSEIARIRSGDESIAFVACRVAVLLPVLLADPGTDEFKLGSQIDACVACIRDGANHQELTRTLADLVAAIAPMDAADADSFSSWSMFTFDLVCEPALQVLLNPEPVNISRLRAIATGAREAVGRIDFELSAQNGGPQTVLATVPPGLGAVVDELVSTSPGIVVGPLPPGSLETAELFRQLSDLSYIINETDGGSLEATELFAERLRDGEELARRASSACRRQP